MAGIHRQCSSNEQHVAVLAFPFGTHAAPLLALTRRLADAASDVTFSFFTTAKSNSSIFGSKPHGRSNLKSYDVEDGLPEGYQFKGPEEAIQLFLKASPGNFNKGLEVAVSETKKSISCIMSDSFLWFAADMADELGVPWLPLWTAGAFSLSAHFYTDLIRSTVAVGPNGIAGREDETLDFIPGMSAARLRDLPEGILTGNLESGFSVMLHWMGRMLPRAAAVTINSFQELNPATTDDLKSKFNQCLSVGPITQLAPQTHEPDQTGCLSWLDLQKPCSVVYVSFGTVIALPPDELAALAKGLEASGAPFIWSLKDRLTGQLPEGFLDATRGRGMVVPWAPQSQVLEHPAIGAFVTHGGWNSVLESITGGVPMICRPVFGDQRQNGRMVSDVWGIGVMIEGGVLTEDGVVKAVDLILGKGEEGRKTREKVWLLKEMAEKAVGPNGSSSKNLDFLVHIIREAGK